MKLTCHLGDLSAVSTNLRAYAYSNHSQGNLLLSWGWNPQPLILIFVGNFTCIYCVISYSLADLGSNFDSTLPGCMNLNISFKLSNSTSLFVKVGTIVPPLEKGKKHIKMFDIVQECSYVLHKWQQF